MNYVNMQYNYVTCDLFTHKIIMLTTNMIDMIISLVDRPFTINIIILNVYLNKSHVDIIVIHNLSLISNSKQVRPTIFFSKRKLLI